MPALLSKPFQRARLPPMMVDRVDFAPYEFGEDPELNAKGRIAVNTPTSPLVNVGDIYARATWGIIVFDAIEDLVFRVPYGTHASPNLERPSVQAKMVLWLVDELAIQRVPHIAPGLREDLSIHSCIPADYAFRMIEFHVAFRRAASQIASTITKNTTIANVLQRGLTAVVALALDLTGEGSYGEAMDLLQELDQQDLLFDILWQSKDDEFTPKGALTRKCRKNRELAKKHLKNDLPRVVSEFFAIPGAQRIIGLVHPQRYCRPDYVPEGMPFTPQDLKRSIGAVEGPVYLPPAKRLALAELSVNTPGQASQGGANGAAFGLVLGGIAPVPMPMPLPGSGSGNGAGQAHAAIVPPGTTTGGSKIKLTRELYERARTAQVD